MTSTAELEDESVKHYIPEKISLHGGIKLYKYYIILVLEIFLFFVTSFLFDSDSFGMCFLYIFIFIITAIAMSEKLGKEFGKAVTMTVFYAIPLSIISYLNEVKNSCFCPFWCTCPEPPGYYHLPRMIALISSIIIFIWSIKEQVNGDKKFGFGLFVGLLCSVMIFLTSTLVGFF